MCVSKVILYLVVVLFYSTKVNGIEQTAANSSVTGYGYEMIIAKLEYLQYKLIEIELTMKEDRETVDQKLTHQETLSEGLLWAINKLSQSMGHNFTSVQSQSNFLLRELSETIGHSLTVLQNQSNKMISQQAACANHEQMRKDIQMLGSKGNWTQFIINKEPGFKASKALKAIRSCKQERSKQTGKYMIQPTENDEPFEGYCDQTTFGGGWLVFQYRFDGSVDFYRNWTQYRDGFGKIDGEFWMGLERLHRLTSARPYELLVELKDFSGNYAYARYDKFEIDNETGQYSLKNMGSYTGTAGDGFKYDKDAKFYTNDRDTGGCVVTHKGAWWHKSCHYANLNGIYKNTVTTDAVTWYYYKNSYTGLAYSRMSIREI